MKLRGLIAATYTPFREDGTVNFDLIGPMIDLLVERGVSGLYVCGSTGEGPSLTDAERKLVTEASVKAAAGRLPVVVQVGSNSQRAACELATHASECGADAISSLPPLYFKPATVEQLVTCMAEIADAGGGLPFYYYHIPRLTGVNLDTVAFLEQGNERIPSLSGVKFSDFFLAEFCSCQAVAGGKYDILFGSDEMVLGALAMGAEGAVGSCYNFAAPLWNRILTAFDEGDQAEALRHQSDATRMVRTLAGWAPFHAVVKQVVLPALGLEMGALRLPQQVLAEDEVRRLRELWDASDFPQLIA